MLLQIVFVVVIAGALVATVMLYLRGRSGTPRANAEFGTLHVTGVSPRPAAQGEQFVTITGTLAGPSVPGETVYGRYAWDVNQWPSPGDEIQVSYPPGKPRHWQIAHPGARPPLGS